MFEPTDADNWTGEEMWRDAARALGCSSPVDCASLIAALKVMVVGCEARLSDIGPQTTIGDLLPKEQLSPGFDPWTFRLVRPARPRGIVTLSREIHLRHGPTQAPEQLTVSDLARVLPTPDSKRPVETSAVTMEEGPRDVSLGDLLVLGRRRHMHTTQDLAAPHPWPAWGKSGDEIVAAIGNWLGVPQGLLRPHDMLPTDSRDVFEILPDVTTISQFLNASYRWPRIDVPAALEASWVRGLTPSTRSRAFYVRLDWLVGLIKWLHLAHRPAG